MDGRKGEGSATTKNWPLACVCCGAVPSLGGDQRRKRKDKKKNKMKKESGSEAWAGAGAGRGRDEHDDDGDGGGGGGGGADEEDEEEDEEETSARRRRGPEEEEHEGDGEGGGRAARSRRNRFARDRITRCVVVCSDACLSSVEAGEALEGELRARHLPPFSRAAFRKAQGQKEKEEEEEEVTGGPIFAWEDADPALVWRLGRLL